MEIINSLKQPSLILISVESSDNRFQSRVKAYQRAGFGKITESGDNMAAIWFAGRLFPVTMNQG